MIFVFHKRLIGLFFIVSPRNAARHLLMIYTGETLAGVWSELVFDDFPVVAEYVENASVESVPLEQSWVSRHCRTSQYLLQV